MIRMFFFLSLDANTHDDLPRLLAPFFSYIFPAAVGTITSVLSTLGSNTVFNRKWSGNTAGRQGEYPGPYGTVCLEGEKKMRVFW
jgi:hypothetical protein